MCGAANIHPVFGKKIFKTIVRPVSQNNPLKNICLFQTYMQVQDSPPSHSHPRSKDHLHEELKLGLESTNLERFKSM